MNEKQIKWEIKKQMGNKNKGETKNKEKTRRGDQKNKEKTRRGTKKTNKINGK